MKRAIASLLLGSTGIILTLWMTNRGESGTLGTTTGDRSNSIPSHPRDGVIQGIGFVEPTSEIRKLVFKVDGVIARCPAEVGRTYKKGEVLMELDGREQLAAASVAEAEWRLAEAERDKVDSGINPHLIAAAEHKVELLKEQVRYCAKEHSRYAALASRDSVTGSEHDRTATEASQRRMELQQAEADLRHLRNHVREEDRKLAGARVNAAKARLDLARQHYEDTLLRAPIDGTVLEILKREGEGARQFDNEPIAVFADTSRLRVRAEVDERFVTALKTGGSATIFGRGLGEKKYSGRVVLIKSIMGKKTVFSRSATERKDLDVVQILIELDRDFLAPVGLEVDVRVDLPSQQRPSDLTTSLRGILR